MSLFTTKSIDQLIESSEEPSHRLKKSLGPWALAFLGVGIVIGSGIFTVTGTAAAGKEKAAGIMQATVLDILMHGSDAASHDLLVCAWLAQTSRQDIERRV